MPGPLIPKFPDSNYQSQWLLLKTHTPTTVWNYDILLWTSSSNNWSFHSILSVSQKFEQGYQDSPLDLTFMRLRLRWSGHQLLSHVTTDYMLLCSPLLAGTIIKLIMTSSSNPVPAGLLAWYSRRADYLSNDKSNFRRVARVAYLGTRNKSRRQADKPIAFRHSDSDLIVLNALSVLRSPCWAGGLRWALGYIRTRRPSPVPERVVGGVGGQTLPRFAFRLGHYVHARKAHICCHQGAFYPFKRKINLMGSFDNFVLVCDLN